VNWEVDGATRAQYPAQPELVEQFLCWSVVGLALGGVVVSCWVNVVVGQCQEEGSEGSQLLAFGCLDTQLWSCTG
jgi:hypothetical protein